VCFMVPLATSMAALEAQLQRHVAKGIEASIEEGAVGSGDCGSGRNNYWLCPNASNGLNTPVSLVWHGFHTE
jgi:hypothetical protein